MWAVLVIAIMLSFLIGIRAARGNLIYPNGEAYDALRAAESINTNLFFSEDLLQNRSYSPNPFDYVVAASLRNFGAYALFALPIALGILTALLFYRMLVLLGFPRKNAGLCTMLLAATPAFLSSFSTLSRLGFAVLLSLLVMALYFEPAYWDFPWKISGKIYFGFAIAALCLLSITSLLAFLITIVLMMVLSTLQGRGMKSMLFASSIPFLFLLPVFTYTDYLSRSILDAGFHAFNLRESFSVLGASLGLDFFVFLLFLTGFVILWSFIKELRIYHLLSLLFIVLSLFNPLFRIYASMMMTVYCVVAIKHLYYRKWELELIKSGTVMLIACAVLFSLLSETTASASREPAQEATLALQALASMPPGTVFTQPSYGYTIEFYAAKPVLLDDSSPRYPGYYEKLYYYNALLNASRIADAETAIQKLGIKYFLITPMMKEDIWYDRDEKLLLLLKNSNKFENRFDSGFEIWEYVGEQP